MRQRSKQLLTILILYMIVLPVNLHSQSIVAIDHVDGLINGKIQSDVPIKFHIRWTNNFGTNITGGVTGYRLFLSNNGVLATGQFEPPIIDTLPIGFADMFDLSVLFDYYSVDGLATDSVSILFWGNDNVGLPDGYDELTNYITTKVSSDYAGDSLCIDSTLVPAHHWTWFSTSGHLYPDWSGPHCYEILPSCCVGTTGNADNSPDDEVDISDLQYIVDFVFLGGSAPVCLAEADFVNDGVDVADVVFIVEYIFLHGPPPPACL